MSVENGWKLIVDLGPYGASYQSADPKVKADIQKNIAHMLAGVIYRNVDRRMKGMGVPNGKAWDPLAKATVINKTLAGRGNITINGKVYNRMGPRLGSGIKAKDILARTGTLLGSVRDAYDRTRNLKGPSDDGGGYFRVSSRGNLEYVFTIMDESYSNKYPDARGATTRKLAAWHAKGGGKLPQRILLADLPNVVIDSATRLLEQYLVVNKGKKQKSKDSKTKDLEKEFNKHNADALPEVSEMVNKIVSGISREGGVDGKKFKRGVTVERIRKRIENAMRGMDWDEFYDLYKRYK